MASLKEKVKNNLTDGQKINAEFFARDFALDLIEAKENFRLSSHNIGSYSFYIPDQACRPITIFFADQVRLFLKNELIYESDWSEFDYQEFLDFYLEI